MTETDPPRIVPPAKLTEDLLRPDHPVGGAKAKFFRAFGFSLDRRDTVMAAPSRIPTTIRSRRRSEAVGV